MERRTVRTADDRTAPRARTHCPEADRDLKDLLRTARPLGDSTELIQHATRCPSCFARLRDLFLATAPDDSDPIHRLIDGLNHAVYRLAKAILATPQNGGAADFRFDQAPGAPAQAAEDALARLTALDEYSNGRSARSSEAAPLKELLKESAGTNAPTTETAEQLLRRSIAIGGRYGLDAANLLGFIHYRNGDLDGAELLFRTVLDHSADNTYERETQAHAMNNLTGVELSRGDLKSAILWCERSLMLKQRLRMDVRSNYLNLCFFWLEQGTPYGIDRARHYVRELLALDDGKKSIEQALASTAYSSCLADFKKHGFDREFPEIAVHANGAREKKPERSAVG